jgi:hypothetical protein
MWTAASISATTTWEEVLWRASCTWRDEADAEPVILALSGRAPLGDDDGPVAMLRAALRALEHESESGSVRLRDSASPVDF